MEWRPVKGFSNYEISDHGHINRLAHTTTYTTKAGVSRTIRFGPQPLKTQTAEDTGTVTVTLMRDGKYHWLVVARLVLLTHVGDPPFPGAFALHRDDVKENNWVGNLRWGTAQENWQDTQRNGIKAVGMRQPTCDRGHDLTPENTYISPGGARWCRECQRRRDRERYQRRKKRKALVTG